MLEGAFVVGPIFEIQGALAVIQIIFESASVSQFFSVDISLNSLSFPVLPLVSVLFIPLFSLSVNHSAFKLPVLALGLSHYRSNSMREIILEESEIVKTLTVKFPVTFFLAFHQFAFVVRSIDQWNSLVSFQILLIIYFKSLHVLSEIRFAYFLEESITVDYVVLHLAGAGLALCSHLQDKENITRDSKIIRLENETNTLGQSLCYRYCKLGWFGYFYFQTVMKSNEQERLVRYILKWQPKTQKEVEASLSFRQYISKRKKKIELLQAESVSNQLYIFPRKKVLSTSSSSISDNLENERNEPLQYCLPQQNKRNKSYQHSSQVYFKTVTSVADKNTGREEMKTKGGLNLSLQKNQFEHSQNRTKLQKEGTPNKNHSKKRKKQEEKTVLNSSKKLIVAQQYSLGANHNQVHTKKGSQNVTMTCRTKPPRLRVKTQA